MRTTRMLLLRIIFLTLLFAISPFISAQQDTWKDWNHYQLLGLQSEDYYYTSGRWAIKSRRERAKERRQIQTKDIKKAYRKQAQAWHPDKIITRKKQQEQGNQQDQINNSTIQQMHSIDYSNISVEECNARFSKIAEAYDILSDEEKRRDYDEYLLQMEDSMQNEYKRREKMENQRFGEETMFDTRREPTYQSKFTDSFFDAASVFEDFFFGSPDSSKSKMEDLFDIFFTTGGSKKYSHRQPDRMSETTTLRYDPKYRRQIVQVLQKEEFDEPSRNRIYYRVIGQEFFEEVDFYGRVVGYIPISDPTIVEEGETTLRSNQYAESRGSSKSNRNDYRRRVMKTNSHRIERNQYITPRSAFLRSINGEYYARLTNDCELVVMHDMGEFLEDTFVWSSGTYLPPQYRGKGCALAMYGPRIAIVIGDIDDPTTVLWSSPSPPPIVPGSSFEGEEVIDFYCSLDGDGSIAVYRTRKKVELSVNGNDLWSIAQMWWSELIGGEPLSPPKTHAAAKWKSIQRWAILKTTGRPATRKSTSRGEKMVHDSDDHIDECVFATGLAGCLTPGRYVINISKHVKRSLQKAVVQLDEKVGDFVDSLYDIDDDDTDLLDTFVRVMSKAGISLGSQVNKLIPDGILFAQKIAHWIEKLVTICKHEFIDYFEKISLSFRETTKLFTQLAREKYDDVVHSWEL